MPYSIRKAAVIGAGTMGGGIAALLVGVGIETVLLDIPPSDSRPGGPIAKRNAIVLEGIKRLRNSRPAALFTESDAELIQVGNLEDNLHLLGDVDWVLEAVVEKLDVKQALM